ncbi:ComEC/Rec2 family competence protein [Woodsholea maritima]|uniref:ComEC/Rec2 family competence protein n=1 Tax=Woodsholea maritima TaxID=240237 RepID=UPI0014616173|nr:ComEC/Rec2 family competence protein [Woodsholea maritima]
MSLVFILLPLILGFSVVFARRHGGFLMAGFGVAFVLFGYVWSFERTPQAPDYVGTLSTRAVDVTGWIEAVDLRGRDRIRIRVASLEGFEKPPKRIEVRGSVEGLEPGHHVRLRAVLSAPQGPVLRGGYDPARAAWFERIGFRGYSIAKIEVDEGAAVSVEQAWLNWRWHISQRIVRETGLKGGIAAAVLTGERAFLEAEDVDILRRAGLGHILAISGLHMSLVCASVFFLARCLLSSWDSYARAHDPRRPASLIAFGVGAAYLIMSGASVSTQRAFIMVSVVLIGTLLHRRAISMRALAISALIVLLITPWSIMEAGFQMSFAATAALVAAYEAIRDHRRTSQKGSQSWLAKLGNFIGGLSLTSLVAGSATGAVAAFHFQRLAGMGFVINVVVMPIFTLFIMPVGLISLCLMPFGLSHYGFGLMGRGLEVLVTLSDHMARWGGDMQAISAPPGWVFALVMLGLVILLLGRSLLRPLGLVTVMTGAVLWAFSPQPSVFIQDEGLVVAEGEAGWMVSSTRRGRFDRSVFLQRIGEAEDVALTQFRCDDVGCSGETRDGLRLAITHQGEALEADCALSQVIIFHGDVSPYLRRRCQALILDDEDRRRAGGSLLYTHKGQIYRIETVERSRTRQPWTRPATPYQGRET